MYNTALRILIVGVFSLLPYGLAFGQQSSVVARIGKSSADGFGQHRADSAFPCANGGTQCSTSGNYSATISDNFVTSRQNTFASASIAYGSTEEFAFVHPNFRVAVMNRGATGNRWGSAYGSVSATQLFTITPNESLPDGTLELSALGFQLYDHGELFVPKLQKFYHDGHKVEYTRDFSVSSVKNAGTGHAYSISLGTASGSHYHRELASRTGSDWILPIDNTNYVEYKFNEHPLIDAEGEGLDFVFKFSASAHTSHGSTLGLDYNTTAYSQFGNTSGIWSIQLLDLDGNDVSQFFDIYSESGALQFAVPEPSAALLVALGLSGFMAVRSFS